MSDKWKIAYIVTFTLTCLLFLALWANSRLYKLKRVEPAPQKIVKEEPKRETKAQISLNKRKQRSRKKRYKARNERKAKRVYRAWYEGGTLHKAKVSAWQNADYKNKLATCADFIAAHWKGENFKPSIHYKINTVDDIRPYAVELVICIDGTVEEYPDSELDHAIANLTVAEIAIACMMMMDWMK